MAFTIQAPHVDQPESPTKALVADRRLYLALDERTLVEYGDASARFLLAAAGRPIPGPVVDRLGLTLVDGRVQQRAEERTPQLDEEMSKRAAPDADKQAQPDGDKMLTPQGDKSGAPASKRERK